MVGWWRGQLSELGVTVHLNWEITPGSPALAGADELVIATGALPVHPVTISGLGREGVLDVLAVHRGAPVGHRVVVVGGGLSGADLALDLAAGGHEVVVVEQEAEIARDMLALNRRALLRQLDEVGVTVLTGHTVSAVEPGAVVAAGVAGVGRIEADSVVIALGMRPNAALTGVGLLEDPRVHVVGDCLEPAKVGDAVHAAFAMASAL